MADFNKSNLKAAAGIQTKDACVVLVKSEWNSFIVDELEKGCRKKLKEMNVRKIVTITVPGAIEIPFAIKAYWDSQHGLAGKPPSALSPDAFIALACVIRGGTPHFDYVCNAVTGGVVLLNHSLPVPTIFGVLTVDNESQARERTGGRHGHKGEESAITAVKMIALNQSLKSKIPSQRKKSREARRI